MRFSQVFGGCPKRKNCSLYQNEAKTCNDGPYQYCGKYRSIVETKNIQHIEASNDFT